MATKFSAPLKLIGGTGEDELLVVEDANGNVVLSIKANGVDALADLLTGPLTVSGGTAAKDRINFGADVTLFRSAVNVFETPDTLIVGALGVANYEAANTPGTVTNKVEVFDEAGVSLGFLAVYDDITVV